MPRDELPLLTDALEDCIEKRSDHYFGTTEELDYLLSFSRILAIFAVWDSNAQWIRNGIIALIYEEERTDYRDTLTHFAMLNHSAGEIGANFDQLAEDLVDQLSPDLTGMLRAFIQRPREERAIENFRHRAVVRGGKFDFKPIR